MTALAQVRDLGAVRASFFLSPFTNLKLYLQNKTTCHYFHYYYTNPNAHLSTALAPKGFLAPPLPLAAGRRLQGTQAAAAAVHGLRSCGTMVLAVLEHVGSSWTRDQTRVPAL